MISTRGYSVIGWVVWQIARRSLKKEFRENRAKLGAAGAVTLVLLGGILAARAGNGES
jgi:hypothetical protein